MGMFSTREPRKFRRVSIYTDEHRDKIQKIVDDVNKEEGRTPVKAEDYTDPDHFKGKFSEFTPRAQRYKENGHGRLKWPIALIAIIILIMIWHYLLTGNVHI